MECAICLNGMRMTRNTKTLECGHSFHSQCFTTWESSGGSTCPLCRDFLRKCKYRITVNIQNMESNASTQRISERVIGGLDGIDRMGAMFDVDDLEELEQLIDNGFFGTRRSDFDTSIFNTE